MERRREFFDQLFAAKHKKTASESENREDLAVSAVPEETMDRRGFLGKAGEFLAGAAVGSRVLVESRSASAGEIENTKEKNREIEREMNRLRQEIDFLIFDVVKEMPEPARDFYARTLSEQDEVRARILDRRKEQIITLIKKFLEIYLPIIKDEGADQHTRDYGGSQASFIVADLWKVDCYGLWYEACGSEQDREKMYKQRQVLFPFNEEKMHYTLRVADFLPKGSMILDEEIDPRIYPPLNYKVLEDVEKALKEYPAWADYRRQELFRSAIDTPSVRKLLQQTDCTLAEAYSIVKAAIVYREQYPTTKMEISDIVTGLLQKREAFKKEVILGPDVGTFIHFDYVQKKDIFDGDFLDKLWYDTRSDEEKNFVGPTENFYNKGLVRIRGEGDANVFTSDLSLHISNSKEKTVIYFNTHGSPKGIKLNNQYALPTKMIALDLASRLYMAQLEGKKNTHDFGQVKIIFDTCFSHELSINLIADLRDIYEHEKFPGIEDNKKKTLHDIIGVPFEEITLPTVIAASQEGSLTYSTVMKLPLRRFEESVKREGKLTGDFIMRRLQPMSYPLADITIFYGQKQGQLLEIGEVNSASKIDVPV